MSTKRILSSKNIVITANSFNPSIFRENWLISNKIIENESLIGNFTFSNQVVQFSTKGYSLLVLPTQIQITLLEDKNEEIIESTIKRIVELLPHVPYSAIGINFNWQLFPIDGDDQKLSKTLFYSSESPVFKALNTENSYFGGYVSNEFLSSRMKLDIKPQHKIDKSNNNSERWINFSFNYHHDIQIEDAVSQLHSILNNWSKYFTESEKIMNTIVNDESN